MIELFFRALWFILVSFFIIETSVILNNFEKITPYFAMIKAFNHCRCDSQVDTFPFIMEISEFN